VRSITNQVFIARPTINVMAYATAPTCIHIAIVIAVSGSGSAPCRYLVTLRTPTN
jgi:hypothetical protein